jgi:hypothetical protein
VTSFSVAGSRTRALAAPGASVLAVAGVVAVTAVAGLIGADARWAAALGQSIARHGSIPDGVPFASAPSAGWPNVPVVAELLFGGLASALGDRGLFLLDIAAVAATFGLLRRTMLAGGATEGGAAVALLLVGVGSFPDLAIVRLQLFSLVCFAALLFLLERARTRSLRSLPALPLLFAAWSNLHGAVLVGLVVLAVYLVFEHRRHDRRWAFLLLAGCTLSICLTPATYRTPLYYLGVARSEPARQGFGLWEHLSPSNGLHVALVVCLLILIVLAVRGGLSAWEAVSLALLVGLTGHTARTGVWLLMVAAIPASQALRGRRSLGGIPAVAAGALVALAILYGLVRGPIQSGASRGLLEEALELAQGTPVLADGILAEQVALAGGRVWLGNPVDAFDSGDQRLYLAWLKGDPSGDRALEHAPRVVLVQTHSSAARRIAASSGWRPVARDGSAIVYVRPASSASLTWPMPQ